MEYDPMLLESSLPYPDRLDKTVLDVRAREGQEVLLLKDAIHENVIDAGLGCMDVIETSNSSRHNYRCFSSREM